MAERSTRARIQEIAAASALQLALEDDDVVLATCIRIVMTYRTILLNTTLPHKTWRDTGGVGNSTSDKVYLSDR